MRGKIVKWFLTAACSLALAFGLSMSAGAATGDVAINATNFPDPIFRAYVTENLNRDSDKKNLSQAELDCVVTLDVSDLSISSLKGIEYFKKLQTLDCYDNQLSSLDVSKNTALTTLVCSRNKITSLDLSHNPALERISCDENRLTSLNVSSNPKLKWVECYVNQITNLDISKNTKLVQVAVDYDVFRNLEKQLSNCPDLFFTYVLLGLPSFVDAKGRRCMDYSNVSGLNVSLAKGWINLHVEGKYFILESDFIGYYTYPAAGNNYIYMGLYAKEIAPAITSNPSNQTVTAGQTATFKVKTQGEGMTYQWQYRLPGSAIWKNSTVSSATKATFSFTATDTSLSGRQYRCVVKDSNHNTRYSSAVTLTVQPALAITKQPASVTTKVGSDVSFAVTATGTGLTYQWQYKLPGSTTWSNSGLTSAKKATFTFNANSENLSGRQYRCVVKNSDGKSVTSNTVTLTVGAGPVIVNQPASVTTKVGSNVSFAVTATGTGLTYQWQYKLPGSTTWSNSGLTSAKKATFTFNANSESLCGRQYRCVVKNSSGKTVTSKAVTLTVGAGPVIVNQPASVTTKVGSSAKFTVTAAGSGLTYQWQYKLPGSTVWKNSSVAAAKKATFTFTATSTSLNGRQYRCVIKNSGGKTVTSKAVTLTVK